MKTIILALLVLYGSFAAPCFAAFTFTTPGGQPIVSQITPYGARIMSTTSVITTSYLVWDYYSHACTITAPPAVGGQSACLYPNMETPNTPHGVFNWFIGGATSGTLIHFQVISTDGTSWMYSGDQTFTTLPVENPYPAEAIPPQVVPNPVVPACTGTTRTVGPVSTGGCGNFLTCWNASQCGDAYGKTDCLLIPSNSITYSDFTANSLTGTSLPAKTCSQNFPLLVETDQASKLPPALVRLDSTYEPILGTIQGSDFFHYDWDSVYYTFPANNWQSSCFSGAYLWPGKPIYLTGNAPGFSMMQCLPNAPVNITNVTGCTGPGGGDTNLVNCTVTTATAPSPAFLVGDVLKVRNVVGINLVNGTCQVSAVYSPTSLQMGCVPMYIDFANTYVSGGAVNNYSYQPIPACSGSNGPGCYAAVTLAAPDYLPPSGTCPAEGTWGYDGTNATENYDPSWGPILASTSAGSVVRCMWDKTMTTLTWQRWTVWLEDVSSPPFSFSLDYTGSSWIYNLGLRIADPFVPTEPLFLDGSAQTPGSAYGSQGGKLAPELVHTDITSSNITFDRCSFEGADFPHGSSAGALKMDGNMIAIVESQILGSGNWFPGLDRGSSQDNAASAQLVRSAGVGYLFRNNFMHSDNNGMHFDDTSITVPVSDLTVQYSSFWRDPADFYDGLGSSPPSARSNGSYHPHRQPFECKTCIRVLSDGNLFTNQWRDVSASSAYWFFPQMFGSVWYNTSSTVWGVPSACTSSPSQCNVTWPFITGLLAPSSGYTEYLVCTISGLDQLYGITTLIGNNGAVVSPEFPGPVTAQFCQIANGPYGVRDINITNNTLSNLPNVIGLTTVTNSNTNYGTIPPALVVPATRITMTNNLIKYVVDDNPANSFPNLYPGGTTGDKNIWETNGGGYGLYGMYPFGSDVISEHETHFFVGGGLYNTVIGSSNPTLTKNTSGIMIKNNNAFMRDASTCFVPTNCASNSPINGAGLSGLDMINAMFVNVGNLIGNSVYAMAGTAPTNYPSSIKWVSTSAALGFYNSPVPPANDFYTPLLSNFRLRGGAPGSSGASTRVSDDGLDTGPDMDVLEVHQKKVSNAHAHDVTSTTAVIGFLAPDGFGCTVDWGASSAFVPGTYTRVANAGGQRAQNVTLSGLPSNSTVAYRVNCATMQPTGSFKTP